MQDIKKFLLWKIAELRKLIESSVRFSPFSPLIRFWFFSWSTSALLWPVLRISLGREKSFKICSHLLKKPIDPKIIPLPWPIKSKLSIKKTEDYLVLIEIYLENIYGKDVIKKGMNVVDIGAHIGAYTVLAAEKTGAAGKVIAIEPGPQNYNRLIENIKINNFQNITPVKIALSDRAGSEKLYLGSQPGQHSLKRRPLFHPENNAQFIKVNVDTLDNLLKSLNITKIDVIKIDTEGMEMPILAGAKETLKNNPNVKIIVASYHYPEEAKEVQNFLHNAGFESAASPFGIVVTK